MFGKLLAALLLGLLLLAMVWFLVIQPIGSLFVEARRVKRSKRGSA